MNLASRERGTRMARVQTAEWRLRFSMVVTFNMAICRELRVIPRVKEPKRPPLLGLELIISRVR